MAGEVKKEIQLEIAHVLFVDIAGYSKLMIHEQRALLEALNKVARGTDEFQSAEAAGRLIKIPTGDGVALVFRNSQEEPVECALEMSRALKKHPELRLRMGIHSGPVSGVVDVNGRANVAGAGINMAQRVMDCGDAGHILLSKRVAEDLQQYGHWRPYLHDLGECEVKHGVRVQAVNLYTGELGNPEPPEKFESGKQRTHSIRFSGSKAKPPALLVALVVVAVAIVAGALVFSHRSASKSADSDRTKSAPAAAPIITEKSIAVLPFTNLSANQENAFFADGVQDEILTDLAKIADLKVISRTSVMQYKDAAKHNVREIGRQLGVAHVLEGSVQRAGNKVRVNAQLIDARNDAHLWAQSYDRDLADVFAIQSEIADAIVKQLAVHLSSNEKAQIAKPPTNDLVAYDLYLRARDLDDLSNDPNAKGSLLQGIALLEEAVRRDPKFLRAYCLMCATHLDLYWGGSDHTDQRRELARIALEKAEEIQPDAGEVHWQKGLYAYHGFRDYDRALTELELAKRLLPNEARLYVLTGAIDRRTARWKEAEANFNRAVELDPRNFVVLMEAGSTFAGARRFGEAKRLYERALTILPNDPFARFLLGFTSFAEGADVAAWRKELDFVARQGNEAARGVAFPLLFCSWVQRDRTAAEKAVALIPA